MRKLFTLLFCLTFCYSGLNAQSIRIAVNELYNGNGQTSEYIELLVLEDDLDIRGWRIGDNNATTTAWQPKMTFDPSQAIWSHLRKGTWIVVTSTEIPEKIKPEEGIIIVHRGGAYINGGNQVDLAIDGDFVQVTNANGNHVHSLGYDSGPGSSVCSGTGCLPVTSTVWSAGGALGGSPPEDNFSLRTTKLNNSEAVQLLAGSVADYNLHIRAAGDSKIQVAPAIPLSFATMGRGNKGANDTSMANTKFALSLRRPVWSRQLSCVSNRPGQVSFTFSGVTDGLTTDTFTHYLVLRSLTNSFTAPVSGNVYPTGSNLGGATLVGKIRHTGGSNALQTFTDNNPVPGASYRVYASRFSGSGGSFIDNGTAYTDTAYVSTRGAAPVVLTSRQPGQVCTPGTYSLKFKNAVFLPGMHWQYPAGVTRIDSIQGTDSTTITLQLAADADTGKVMLIASLPCPDTSALALFPVRMPAKPVLTAPADVCRRQTAMLSIRAERGVSYNWTSKTGTPVTALSDTALELIYTGPAGYDTVIVTKSNGICSASDTAVIFWHAAPPVLTALTDTAVCGPGVFSFRFPNTVFDTTLRLEYPLGVFRTDSLRNATSTTFSLHIADTARSGKVLMVRRGICPDTTFISLNITPSPKAPLIAGPDTICIHSLQTYSVNHIKGEDAVTYKWSLSSSADSLLSADSDTSVTIKPMRSNAVVYVKLTKTNGLCSITDSVKVFIADPQPLPELIAASNDTICSPGIFTFLYPATRLEKGTRWEYPAGVSRIDSSNRAGQVSVRLQVSASAGLGDVLLIRAGSCPDTMRLPLPLIVTPTAVAIKGDSTACTGTAALFTVLSVPGEAGVKYTWSTSYGTGETTSADTAFMVMPGSATANASITLIKSKGSCSVSSQFKVRFYHIASLPGISGPAEVCPGINYTYSFNSEDSTAYTWQVPAGATLHGYPNENPAVISFEEASSVRMLGLQAVFQGLCTVQSLKQVHISENPGLVIPDTFSVFCESAQFQIPGNTAGIKFRWAPSEGLSSDTVPNPVITINADRIYTLTLTNAAGCIDTRQIAVTYKECLPVAIGNVITPGNADGQNDFIEVKNLPLSGSASIEIYNRWGKKVYSEAEYKNNWNGQNYPAGTYYYNINYTDKAGSHNKTGWIQITK
ncbi:MAG: gliding motility-associated C-terminal domain-containing protein [Bacteroidota bacterium]